MVKLLWASDLHYRHEGDEFGHDPRVRVDALVSHIAAHHADAEALVLSGDMVENATPEDYASLRKRLAGLPVPCLPMVGNHDLRAPFRAALPLPEGAQEGFVQYTARFGGLRLICLDTLTEGRGEGTLCEGRLGWLREELARDAETPTVVFCHHPPLPLGYPMLDPSHTRGGDELVALLQGAPCVRQLLFGHVHRPMLGRVGDLPFASIRSVLYQAPPPEPAWNWEGFTPAREAPDLGILHWDGAVLRLQFEPFCSADHGFTPA